jgi:4-amino-4-deoxy-L-arabinose transferase-like glycosyltransferase
MYNRAMPPSAARGGLIVILAAYLTIGTLYAVRTPAWQAPDEPAHYNYVAHVAATGSLPVLQPEDYDQAHLDRLRSERFPPHLSVEAVRYEGWQPPLYYLLAVPVFALSGGDLLALRLFSLALGGGFVVAVFLLARALFPGLPSVALTAAGFIAFVPQFVAIMASVNNDALALLLYGLGVWLAVRLVLAGQPARLPFVLPGILLGLAFLTKLSAYPLAAVFGVAVLLLARREAWPARRLLRAAAQLFVPALLLGGLWWARNLVIYGGGDFLAMGRHDAIVVGQLRTAAALAEWGTASYARSFARTTFQSFWGQFGWMGVVMDQRVYLALLGYSLMLAAGFGGALLGLGRTNRRVPRERFDALVLLALVALLAVGVYLYYNLSLVQFQGRYLYPALPVVGLAAACGLRQWAAWLVAPLRFLSPAARSVALALLPLAPVALMSLLAVFALYRFIIPALT